MLNETLKIETEESVGNVIHLKDLKPCQAAVIVGENANYAGHIILRTQSSVTFEVLDLSDFRPYENWRANCTVKVRVLEPNEFVMFKVQNRV